MLKTPVKLKNRHGQECALVVTQKEGAGYRWVNCLAVVDSEGQWMINASWRTNHYKKALCELKSYGFTVALGSF